jgi:hypothetical protein
MTEAARLELVRTYTLAGRWEVEANHGVIRMRERGASFSDIRHGLLSGTRCSVQENGRWRLVTEDLDADELTLILFVDDGVLVITLF